MIRVSVIGYGNVAHHLIEAFLKSDNILLCQVYVRSIHKISHLASQTQITDNINNLVDTDVCIISVSDNAISEVSSKIKINNLVVHTSGATAINKLKNIGNKGVFYPLQSFSKQKPVHFATVPFCLEAENEQSILLLEQLAQQLSKSIYRINSIQRKQLHVAAVFVNNFVNHLYKIGNDICNTHNVPFEVLLPLIQETALKVNQLSPKDAQTGPAIRHDNKTIANHLELLNDEQQIIYKLLTESIQNEHKL